MPLFGLLLDLLREGVVIDGEDARKRLPVLATFHDVAVHAALADTTLIFPQDELLLDSHFSPPKSIY
jgi:hypothetical protein